MRTDTGQIVHLADYRPTDFVLERVDLTFDLHPTETKVEARLIFHRREGIDPKAPLVLDGDELVLSGLLLDQTELPAEQYIATPDSLTVRDLPESAPFELTITTVINPEANTQLMGLYRTGGVYCTQCEAEGFRRITYFPDRPDVLAPYTVNIIADKAANPLLLSNGNFLGGAGYGEGKHFAAWFDPHPKPSYLFALVAGDLGVVEDTFVTASGREVALKIYVEHGKEPRAAYAMDALKRSMTWDEERFGREYDLDIFMIVAVSDFNMGAMENKGLNVFNDKYVLADPDIATDADYANIERIIAHEYFHNWTGNRITCRDWFQLCLKEGLTVYRDHEFSADQRSRPVTRIAEVRHLKSEQFPEDGGPLAHPVRPTTYREINNFYTTTVYEKGSEVTSMIATLLGRDLFKTGMDLYFDRHDGQAVTIEDFVKCFEDVSGRDLAQFSLWYHQAGTPLVTASGAYDAAARSFTLSLEQMQPATPGQTSKAPLHIPLRMALIAEDGTLLTPTSVTGAELTGDVLHLTARTQTVVFNGIPSRPVLSLNRSFSTPINLQFSQSAKDLALIARYETDHFARWQALIDLGLPNLLQAARDAREGAPVTCDAVFIDTLLAAASDESLEPAFRALALALPSEADIGRELGGDNDPDAIHTGRQAILKQIAEAGKDIFASLYDGMQTPGPFSPDAASAGRRALRNAALTYLSLSDDSPTRAKAAYDAANNMTDLSAALTILAHRFPDTAEAKAALKDFHDRFAENALVIDKWLAIQAAIPGAATLDRIQGLMKRPFFKRTNPNRMRALVGTFAFSNPTGFGRADGAGYRFLAQEILDIDQRNPQLAARILTSMRSWRSLEPVRADHARSALMQIERANSLSTDVRDIVDRILKD
ncbi:aminopeptidase N [Rhizobium rhizogenes]|uniref:Aminopeptidase N n=1 Tax=Rhizobium rhizogenes (strain K84 / ATCC BAA-868) TaxID=311403 RepID=B9JBM1_RHIR8|nr:MULTISPECIES: aminopeptidase N [Rhizobium]ACM25927.1 aminopeptidase N [Rhizobium rhizogenes K84]OCJ25043.1 aminopeptidase N [Agrobacterium sp. B131/95]EJK84945.1 aminopeptidase N [Rhizobium sp. AP16]MDJ1632921.1 aminopeptidase N [Rhizobium rhizogenes]NTG72908.1 aminopeptidase N [Rhizobium rhizogenes]